VGGRRGDGEGYGDDAMLEAAERAAQLLDEGGLAGAETWHRMILNAIERQVLGGGIEDCTECSPGTRPQAAGISNPAEKIGCHMGAAPIVAGLLSADVDEDSSFPCRPC
jgi:hypothetical protein